MKNKKIYFGVPKARSNFLTQFLYKTFISLITVLVLLSLAIYFLVDLNDYKSQIEKLIQDQTGLELELNGQLELSLLTEIKLSAQDVNLAYQSTPIAGFKQIHLNIELLPFTYQTLSVSSVHLDINFLKINKKYLDKLQFSIPPDSQDKKPESPPSSYKDYLSPAFLSQYIPRIKYIEINNLTFEADTIELLKKIENSILTSKQLKFKISHLPIFEEGEWIVHKPAVFVNSRSQAQLSADSIGINQHQLKKLNLQLNNRLGSFSIKELDLAYQFKPTSGIQLDFDLNGEFSGNLSKQAESWPSVNELQLKDLELESSRFRLHSGSQNLLITNNQLVIKEAIVKQPFNKPHKFPQKWLLDSMIIGQIFSSQIVLDNGRLNNLDLKVDNQYGQLTLNLAELIGLYQDLNAIFGRPSDINFNFNAIVKAKVPQPNAPSSNATTSKAAVNVQALELTSHELLVNISDQDIYRLQPTQIKLTDYPLFNLKQLNLWPEAIQSSQPKTFSLKSEGFSINGKGPKNIQLKLTGHDNAIDFQQLDFQLAQSDFQYTAQMDLTSKPFQWQLQGGSQTLNLKPLFQALGQKSFLDGSTQLKVDIKGLGFTNEIDDSTDLIGDITLIGENIRLNNLDLDKLINHFEESQGVGLMDISAYALAGPVGLVVLKGNDYLNLTQAALDSQGKSNIRAINLEFKFAKGFLDFKDTALSTEKHILAATGSIDLVQDRYHDLQLATIDNAGCVIYKERVSGPLTNPEIIGVNRVVKTIVNPIKSVFKTTQEALDIACDEPFYKGKLAFSTKRSPVADKIISPLNKLGGLLPTFSELNEADSQLENEKKSVVEKKEP